MFGLFVRRRCRRIAIDFNEDEPRDVILLLHDIKAQDAWFLDAFARIRQRGRLECLDTLRFDADMDMNNKHGFPIRQSMPKLK